MAMVGALARTLAPAGGAAPIAGQVEYRWPISRGQEPGGLADDDDLLALLGPGDLQDKMRGLAMTSPTAELRETFQLAAGLSGWADSVCTAWGRPPGSTSARGRSPTRRRRCGRWGGACRA
jgi:hypothetical protein